MPLDSAGWKLRSTGSRWYPGPDLVRTYAELRVACQRAGHALSQREHDVDRWIASTAIRLGVPLGSNDGVFEDAPGTVLETAQD